MAFQKSDLVRAASNNEPKLVEEVLKKYPSQVDFQQDGYTALQTASRKGHLEIMKMLANWGADLNFPDVKYNTPLHFAVKGDQPEAVELLLNLGASMNDRNYGGITPPQLAYTEDYCRCLQKFLQRDPSIPLKATKLVRENGMKKEENAEDTGEGDEKIIFQVDMCAFCKDHPALVHFEPCGHLVACFLCSLKNPACVECGVAVKNVSFTKTNQVEKYMEQVKKMHAKIKQLEEITTCSICRYRKIDCTLACGHMYCCRCVRKWPNPSRESWKQDWTCFQCKKPSRYTKLFPPWDIPERGNTR